MESTYDADFYAWANTQAALLRSGRIDQADIEHIAEETFPPVCPFTVEEILNDEGPGNEPKAMQGQLQSPKHDDGSFSVKKS